jgi:hypothetical protein
MINNSTFLQHFPDYCLLTFDDRDYVEVKDKSFTTVGSPSSGRWDCVARLNGRGAGVFFTPNKFPLGKRKKIDCMGVNAWFFEIDDFTIEEQWGLIKGGPLMPDMIVQTKKSLHCYFLAKDGTVANFERIQKGLVEYYGADSACIDISRVLRMPGFNHNKQKEPFKVEVVHYEPRGYSEAEMLESYPWIQPRKEVSVVRKVSVDSESLGFWEAASSLNNKIVLQRLSGSFMVRNEIISFRVRPGGGEYLDVDGGPADAWIDDAGMIGSGAGKKGGPTYIQWLGYYGWNKRQIAKWVKSNCNDLLPKGLDDKNEKEGSKGNHAEKLHDLFLEQNPTVFRDQMDEGYSFLSIDGKNVLMKCESGKFSKYLGRLYWKETGKAIGNEAIQKVTRLISANAEYGDVKYKLFNRVGKLGDSFWYDLGDGGCVETTRAGWNIVRDIPILFKSHHHQNVQIAPSIENANLRLILVHIRIKRNDQQILFLVWLVAAFVPGIPHPILALYGEKGASKSTTMRLARELIDPSKASLLTLPGAGELVQQLSHHYAPCYDNVTTLGKGVSDILCRAVTGAGSSKRKLFSDDDDVIYQYRRVMSVNGINNAIQKPDLLDRSILIELARIPKKERKTEAKLNKAFEKDKPIILAGIFDALSKGMALIENVKLEEFPRMADFAEWGCAIAEAIGVGQDAFIEAYNANIGQQNDEVILNDSVAYCLCSLLEGSDVLEGSPMDILAAINTEADRLKLAHDKDLPNTPSVLGKHIKEIQSNLLEAGVYFEDRKDRAGNSKRGRWYVFSKTPVADVAHDGNSDGSDGSLSMF